MPQLRIRVINIFQLSSGHGLVIGPLKILESDRLVDCFIKPVIIDDFSRSRFCTSAQAVLVVEKDATFQKLIDDGFLSLFPKILLVTVNQSFF